MRSEDLPGIDPAWLPPEAFRALGSRRVILRAARPPAGDPVLETVRDEVARACARFGGTLRDDALDSAPHDAAAGASDSAPHGASDGALDSAPRSAPDGAAGGRRDGAGADLVLTLANGASLPEEGYSLERRDGVTTVLAGEPTGLLYGLFHVVRLGESAFAGDRPVERHAPAKRRRMLDHWDNVDVHPAMGQVERGYAGGSLFWRDGAARRDAERVRAYGRLLAACGINAISVNNVNVHRTEARLLTDRLGEVVWLADALRPYGVRVHLSVSFAAPVVVGGLPTADPLDEAVRAWWAGITRRVYEAIPDFGGYVVKADSEGQPGPFGYGRTHAEGANALADALAPFGGVVHWRAFVYNHRQDWRDRSTDRARAAHDHFTPLDGAFRANAILQVKHGPMDFQTREPVSPVIAAMPRTRVSAEFQVTQEYTGQQRHVCYLAPMWSEVLRWGWARGTVAGTADGLVAVSNVGDDAFWTGHPLAQANLYAFGRLAWDPGLEPSAILDEWIDLTFGAETGARRGIHDVMDDSWRTYERYTAPLGVGFMVRPADHYGPDVDGYEYTPWGTYHFADRDGVGVDRTRATGTGFTGQYPEPWSERYESLDECPDEVLLFFHHVPYGHLLRGGSTVIQHIYDTHFAGAERAAEMLQRWRALKDDIPPAYHARVADLLDEQVRSAEEWRDQINAYFFRASGVPDARGRRIY
ncbi:alpha-glucuronidase [Rhizomonospora bruguierae]|uniref:alpha-glucuronidase n=1 Tax=Rhizomonospora bruguierae TaxID=1581705 RepID=UPI001BD01742|nr:alpha-glucuronidase [Micromonospora sp. NBRC 107566]